MTGITPGLYETPVTSALQRSLASIDSDLVHRTGLENLDTEEVLVRYVSALVRRGLRAVSQGADESEAIASQVKLVNQLGARLDALVPGLIVDDDMLAESHDALLGVAAEKLPDGQVRFPVRPEIPMTSSALLVNGRNQPQIGREVVKELATADHVDLLCAFVKWHGVRLIEDAVKDFLSRGGELRVITTTYMGATDAKAVERLVELGAKVAVSYDTHRTRLHAKAWLFHRESGLDTAYVGSSNLSRSAMLDGVEWNVRIARAEQGHLVDTFQATFDDYWNDPSFELYEPDRDRPRLREALKREGRGPEPLPLQIANFDIHPYPYQQEVLDELRAVREVHGRNRNLVVMATGTGKTMVAALDYQRLRQQGLVDSLLFIAHRKEILAQSLSTFRTVLRDGSFGELLVGEHRPDEWKHVFGSIQSLNQLTTSAPERFSMVIVDEFHHAAAASYARLLDGMQPAILLGLTATPERADGGDILQWFDAEKPDVELRLWEALERGLLVPFHYFGIHDDVDLRSIAWRRGTGYDTRELEQLYTGLDSRVRMVAQALTDKLGDLSEMKALGFCVSIQHAEYMADRFNKLNIPARAVSARTDAQARDAALRDLRSGQIKAVFAVDLFNEGVDVPDINTVLFLRPTESATVFLQQLGRGLRLTKDKAVLTVLDFVGHQNKEFRFDKRFTALTGIPRGRLGREVEAGFPTLPAGCAIDLDREVSKIVIENIRQSLTYRLKDAADELRQLGDAGLGAYLEHSGRDLGDLYGGERGGWARLRRAAGFDARPVHDLKEDKALGRAVGRMLHMDDPERLTVLGDLLHQEALPGLVAADPREVRLMWMLHASLDASRPLSALEENLRRLWEIPARREELVAVIDVLRAGIHRVTPIVSELGDAPIHLHARYTKDELLAAFGVDRPSTVREGVRWAADHEADLFMVTINKTEKGYKPSTMYNDRAISQTEFQWESQSTTRAGSVTGQRYITHEDRGSSVHLFIRERQVGPYLYAGPMTYSGHEGERPMRIRWRMRFPLPADVYHYAKAGTG